MSVTGTAKLPQGGRFEELDVLRGLAAFAVVLVHFFPLYDHFYLHVAPLWFEVETTDTLKQLGIMPVSLFFIISGFVIFMTLDRVRSTADFAVSRFSRLFPAYWVCLTLTVIVTGLMMPAEQLSPGEIAVNYTMFQRFFAVPNVDEVYWTLYVELKFYILMALAFRFRLLQHIEKICAGWLALAVTAAVFDFAAHPLGYVLHDLFILEWAPFFLAGICFYLVWSGRISRLVLALIAATCAANFLIAPLWSALVQLCFWPLFALAVTGRLRFIICRPLLFLGTISYSLYLVHQNIGFYVINALQQGGMGVAGSVAIATVIGLVLATAVTFLVEKPALRLIRHIWKAHKDRHATIAQPASAGA